MELTFDGIAYKIVEDIKTATHWCIKGKQARFKETGEISRETDIIAGVAYDYYKSRSGDFYIGYGVRDAEAFKTIEGYFLQRQFAKRKLADCVSLARVKYNKFQKEQKKGSAKYHKINVDEFVFDVAEYPEFAPCLTLGQLREATKNMPDDFSITLYIPGIPSKREHRQNVPFEKVYDAFDVQKVGYFAFDDLSGNVILEAPRGPFRYRKPAAPRSIVKINVNASDKQKYSEQGFE